MLAWADHNLANVDPPLTFITANMFRHVYATNLYYAWYNQDAAGMDGKPNPFLGMEWHDFVASVRWVRKSATLAHTPGNRRNCWFLHPMCVKKGFGKVHV